jgi:hypothetical protein
MRSPMTSEGTVYGRFRRALQHGNLLVAEAAAREIGRVTLVDALALLVLIAEKDPRRYPRAAARWLGRWLEETPRVRLDDATFVLGALAALRDGDREQAAGVLTAACRSGRQDPR